VTRKDLSIKAREAKRLWLFVVIVLGLPALVSQFVPTKRHFAPEPIASLRSKNPDLVLIGDSMLDSRVDARLLEGRLGDKHRVEILWNGGAASACWYLMLKNYVVASEIHPKRCCIFFRDRLLTDPTFRTAGIFRSYFESLMHDDEPAVRAVLGEGTAPKGRGLTSLVTLLYPLDSRRHVYQEAIGHAMFRVPAPNAATAKKLERLVNKTFDVAKMRGEVMAEASDVSEAVAQPFDPNPRRSFLPHIVETAAQARIPLCFVRVKRHPDSDGQTPQTAALRLYIHELRAWLESHECVLIDDTNDPSFTPDMYLKAKDDHIGPWAKKRSTEIYAEKLHPLLVP
jgi:hypothetical protein